MKNTFNIYSSILKTVVSDKVKFSSLQKCVNTGRPLWFVFSGMGSQWPSMGRQMMKFEVFKQSIMSCDAILQCHGVSLYDMIMKGGARIYDECLNSFLGITSIQVISNPFNLPLLSNTAAFIVILTLR